MACRPSTRSGLITRIFYADKNANYPEKLSGRKVSSEGDYSIVRNAKLAQLPRRHKMHHDDLYADENVT